MRRFLRSMTDAELEAERGKFADAKSKAGRIRFGDVLSEEIRRENDALYNPSSNPGEANG